MSVILKQLEIGPAQNFQYFIGCNETKEVAIVDPAWDVPAIFPFLQKGGNISSTEMSRAFNMGVGVIVVVPDHAVLDVMQRIQALEEKAYVIGEILDCKEAGRRLIWD